MADDVMDDNVVTEAKKRYEIAKSAYSANRALAIEDTRFAWGDSDNGWQWPDDIRLGRKLERKVCLTVNLTAQHCNQIINNIRQNRPQCRVLPVDNGADKKTAEILAGLIRNIQTSSNADDAHDLAAEHSIYGGEGYWRVITEYETPESFEQCIKIKSIIDPMLVYIDPAAKELDKSDAEWGFIFEDITRQQCKREYPDVDPASWVEDTQGWVKEDMIRRAEYFYAVYEDDVAYLLIDGTGVLKSEIAPEEQETIKQMIVKERKTKSRRWKWCILIGGEDKPVEVRDWPGAYLPIVSVIGKEININGEIVRKGLVRDLKDPARMVNFSYSEAIQSVALQNKIPYIAPAEAIEGYEDRWANANSSNFAYLPYNSVDESGNAIPAPQRQPPAVMPSAQVQLLQLSTEEMRAASGQQNANFGIKSEAASGIGIQRLKAQGEVATFHFPDNQVRGLRYEAQILVDLIPKIYDTKRVIRVLGLDGKDQMATLDPSMQQPYAEVDSDDSDINASDIQKIFNPAVGRYDVVIDTGPSYQTQRQEAADQLTELASRNPQLMQIAGDIIVRSYDFPMADQLAKRLEKALPPNLADNKKKGPTPQEQQLQQQLQQAQGQLQTLGEEFNKMHEERDLKLQELTVKRYSAETDRLKILAPTLGPQITMPLAQEFGLEVMQAPPIYPGPQQPPEAGAPVQAQPPQPPMPPDGMAAQPNEQPPAGGFFTPNQAPQPTQTS